MTPTQKHELEMSGLLEVRAASYSIGVKDSGVRETVFLDVPAASRKGVLGLIDGESADLGAFYAAPRNSILAWTFKVNPEQLLEKGVALAEMENPQARENVAAALLFLGQQLNLDPKKDILGAFTGQSVVSLSIPHKNDKVAVAFPQPIVALRIKDLDSFKRMSAALTTAGQEKFDFKEVPENGRTIVVAREKDAPPNEVKQFCYVVDGSDLLISFYPLALREELARRTSQGRRLDDDPDFNLARSAMTGQPQAMLYLDTAALGVAAYDVLIPLAQMLDRNAQIDLNALPSADVLKQNLGSALMDLHLAADGILVEGFSPSGVLGLVVPAAAGAGMYAARNGQDAAQAFNRPRGNNNPIGAARAVKGDPKKVETLEKLARDLKEYATEHGGDFPKKLDDMKPKYLQDLGKEIEQIVYLGKQAAENRVVAHSSEKMPGSIAILLQNGTVQSVLRPFLGKVLREGYFDANQAVKPPKAPEF